MKWNVKNMTRIFATVFNEIDEIHFSKDPCMIPYTFSNDFGYEVMVPISSRKKYPSKDKFFSEIDTPVINDTNSITLNKIKRIIWVFKNAKRIDVLNVFFFRPLTWITMKTYLLRNRKGLVYVHCDSNGLNLFDEKIFGNPLLLFISKYILLTGEVINRTLWGLQNRKKTDELKNEWPFKNLEYVPNGLCRFDRQEIDYSCKENTILFVGRIGSPEKRADIVLEGFTRIKDVFHEWKLVFIGTITEDFKATIISTIKENPDLGKRILYLGEIKDRKSLQSEYSKAKVYCNCSTYESFGLTTIEAMSCGCYVLGSDIIATKDITDYGKYGTYFKNGDLNDFCEKLSDLLKNEIIIKENMDKVIDYVYSKFIYSSSLKIVKDWIENQSFPG